VRAQAAERAASLLGERLIDQNVVKLWGYSFVGTVNVAADWWLPLVQFREMNLSCG
jgi:hypothetical protein